MRDVVRLLVPGCRAIGLITLTVSATSNAHAASSPCDAGWSSLRASIVSIDPPSGVVFAVGDKTRRPLAPLDYVCAGETINPTDGVRVEVLDGGKRITVFRGPHLVQGAPSLPEQARKYLDLVFDAVGGLRPARQRAMPTGVRGGDSATHGYERVRLIKPLRDLPRQSLVPAGSLVIAWRGGVGPYYCRAVSEDLTERWRSESTMESWCEVPGSAGDASRLEVLDGRGARAGVNVALVQWSEVPRPPWSTPDVGSLSANEAGAWAAWLWRSGDPKWRLFAIAMLHRVSGGDVVASQLLERALDESLPTE